MLSSFITILSKAPRGFWVILAIAFLGCSFTISAGVFVVLFRASSFEYKGDTIEFSLDRANSIAENSDILTDKIADLEGKIERLKTSRTGQQAQEAIADIDKSIQEDIKPTVEKVNQETKELIENETE